MDHFVAEETAGLPVRRRKSFWFAFLAGSVFRAAWLALRFLAAVFGDAAALLGRVLLHSGRDRCTHSDLPVACRTSGDCHCTWNKAYVVAQAYA